MRPHPWGAALAAAASFCCLTASADAAVTATQITSPTGDVKTLTVKGNPASESLAVTGTATAADGDKVDVRCYGSDTSRALATALTVTGGAFSGTLDLTKIDDEGFPCVARAVPTGVSAPPDPSRFAGPRMFVSRFEAPDQITAVPVNGGGTAFANVFGAYTGSRGVGFSYEPGDDSLYELGPVNPNTLYSTYEFGGYYMFDTAGDFYGANYANTAAPITVDGHSAYTTGNIRELDYDGVAGNELPTGVTSIAASASLDPATNTLTIVETYGLFRCADAGGVPNDTVPITTTSCPRTVPAGVQLVRTKRFTNDGANVILEDAFSSTDGVAHAVKLEYAEEASAYDYVETKGPGDTAFTIRGFGDVLPYTSAPTTLLLRDSDYKDSSYTGAGARTALEQPVKTVWEDDDQSYTTYDIAVPASGSVKRTTVYSLAFTEAGAQAAGDLVEDATGAPTISIASPTAGSTTTSSVAIVAGMARDNKAVQSVKVNGVSAPVASDGTFVLPVALTPGANAIAAVVTDNAGNTNTAATSVTYAPPATPAQVDEKVVAAQVKTCKVPTVRRGVTVAAATATLKKAGCKVALKRVSITSKTKKGRVLATSPAAGTTILADNAVRLTTSKGPKKAARKPAAKGKAGRR